MTDAELDTLIATEVMGWPVIDQFQPRQDIPKTYAYRTPLGLELVREAFVSGTEPWSPSIDPRAAFEMEERLAELDKEDAVTLVRYVYALHELCGATGPDGGVLQLWPLIHATPRQRAEAAVGAVKGKQDA